MGILYTHQRLAGKEKSTGHARSDLRTVSGYNKGDIEYNSLEYRLRGQKFCEFRACGGKFKTRMDINRCKIRLKIEDPVKLDGEESFEVDFIRPKLLFRTYAIERSDVNSPEVKENKDNSRFMGAWHGVDKRKRPFHILEKSETTLGAMHLTMYEIRWEDHKGRGYYIEIPSCYKALQEKCREVVLPDDNPFITLRMLDALGFKFMLTYERNPMEYFIKGVSAIRNTTNIVNENQIILLGAILEEICCGIGLPFKKHYYYGKKLFAPFSLFRRRKNRKTIAYDEIELAMYAHCNATRYRY